MLSSGHCDASAEICELKAEEACDPRLAAEWLLMAAEWRLAAVSSVNDNDTAEPADRDSPTV